MMEVVQYEGDDGKCPFAEWFETLDPRAAVKVRTAIARSEAGNPGDVKAVGEGVSERRIDWGPGYRIYFGKDGPKLVDLLVGGTKRRQSTDIERVKAYWSDYKARRKEHDRNDATDPKL